MRARRQELLGFAADRGKSFIARWNLGAIAGLTAACIAALTPWAYSGVDWDVVFRGGAGDLTCVPHSIWLSERAEPWALAFVIGVAIASGSSLSRLKANRQLAFLGTAIAAVAVVVGLWGLRAETFHPLSLIRCTYDVDAGSWWGLGSVALLALGAVGSGLGSAAPKAHNTEDAGTV